MEGSACCQLARTACCLLHFIKLYVLSCLRWYFSVPCSLQKLTEVRQESAKMKVELETERKKASEAQAAQEEVGGELGAGARVERLKEGC